MSDVPWTSAVLKKKKLTIDASAVHGADWTTAVTAAISELNTLFTANKVNVSLAKGDRAVVAAALASGSYSFEYDGAAYKGSLRSDILHGAARSLDRIVGDDRQRERCFIFLPQDPKVDSDNPRSRNVGEPVMRLIAAHEFLHALGLDKHDPGFEGLLAGSWTLNEGRKPSQDTVTPFGGTAKLPPLTLSADTVKRLRKMWP